MPVGFERGSGRWSMGFACRSWTRHYLPRGAIDCCKPKPWPARWEREDASWLIRSSVSPDTSMDWKPCLTALLRRNEPEIASHVEGPMPPDEQIFKTKEIR